MKKTNNLKGEKMTVREKIKNFVTKLEKKYPSLITNQMNLGTVEHTDLNKYKWTENLVGRDQLMKWKKFKYILKVWEQVDNGSKEIWDINYLFRNYGWYNYDKLLRIETKERA